MEDLGVDGSILFWKNSLRWRGQDLSGSGLVQVEAIVNTVWTMGFYRI